MAERALQLLNFGPDAGPKLIMDLGCGSGLSGQVLSEAGHAWVGLDISPSMLEIATNSGAEGDLCLADMGQGFGFRTGMFDGVISAVMQLYPESAEQLELITTISLRCGFSGGLVVDYPNSRKARKHYLCLFAGLDAAKPLPRALGAAGEEPADGEHVPMHARARAKPHKQIRESFKSRDWVLKKKEYQRKKGFEVRPDSKYTARRRPHLT